MCVCACVRACKGMGVCVDFSDETSNNWNYRMNYVITPGNRTEKSTKHFTQVVV